MYVEKEMDMEILTNVRGKAMRRITIAPPCIGEVKIIGYNIGISIFIGIISTM